MSPDFFVVSISRTTEWTPFIAADYGSHSICLFNLIFNVWEGICDEERAGNDGHYLKRAVEHSPFR